MAETFEELVTKHTRRELEEMALKLGVENLGGTKSQLAEAILDASRKAAPKEELEPVTSGYPKEATPMVEKPKAAAKAKSIGKTGVMAKVSAANKTGGELQKAGKDIRDDGIREMTRGIAEFNRGVRSQVKENKEAAAMIGNGVLALQAEANKLSGEMQEKSRDLHERSKKMLEDGIQKFEAGQADFKRGLEVQKRSNEDSVARFNSGIRDLHSSTDKMSREVQKVGREMREEGLRNLQKGLVNFNRSVGSQMKDNQKAASKIGSGARDLQRKAIAFQGEIHRYQEQDLKNFVRDFYYG
jgi:hypothetical protein